MMTVQTIALTRAIAMLRAAGVQFKVIDGEGREYGDLRVAPPEPERKKAPPRFGRGTLLAYLKPQADAIAVNTCGTIPYGPYNGDARESLRGSLCAYLSSTWGCGTYMTHLNDAGIEVLRLS